MCAKSTQIAEYWQVTGLTLSLQRPLVMGILNVTPDSFYDGGIHTNAASALEHAYQMVAEGADIIDVGGESTRPGAGEITEEEELERILPVISTLANDGVVVSVDTRHASVAAACLDGGAVIVNDVSGFRDAAMIKTVAASEAGCIIMHMQGEPRNMQKNPKYDDVVAEVSAYLLAQAARLEAAGVEPARICIDPGPGFGKAYEHNLALLQATEHLATLGYPLSAAFSRKSFLGRLADAELAADRLTASVFVSIWAAAHGARILRVHDVAETVEVLRLLVAVEGW
ncbi:MAG: dihydropteroate synthase [Coriobacteriia bacterium]|nr:dihydropteroate synthase [Coriobacteriia bacterium]